MCIYIDFPIDLFPPSLSVMKNFLFFWLLSLVKSCCIFSNHWKSYCIAWNYNGKVRTFLCVTENLLDQRTGEKVRLIHLKLQLQVANPRNKETFIDLQGKMSSLGCCLGAALHRGHLHLRQRCHRQLLLLLLLKPIVI